MTHFTFLQAEWPAVFEATEKAEAAVHPDPRTACFYARRSLELAVAWLYKHDPSLKIPYQDNLSALIHEPTFKEFTNAPPFVYTAFRNKDRAENGRRGPSARGCENHWRTACLTFGLKYSS